MIPLLEHKPLLFNPGHHDYEMLREAGVRPGNV